MALVFPNCIIDGELYGTGVGLKPLVRVATIMSGDINTDFSVGSIVDGITLAINDRILLKNQTNGIENGIYVVTPTIPVRSEDMFVNTACTGFLITIDEGNVNADTIWMVTNNVGSAIVGTDSINFIKISSTGEGSGNVNGPISSTNNAIVRFDGTTGKLIKNSNAILSDTGDLNTPSITTNTVNIIGGSNIVSLISNTQTSGYNLTIPTLINNDNLVTTDTTQSLINKTIDSSTNIVRATSLATTTNPVIISGAIAPTIGQTLVATSPTTATWQTMVSSSTSIGYIIDSKTTGTNGGRFDNGAWRTRTLNTIVTNNIGLSLNTNQFTLSPGNYLIICLAPAYRVSQHMCRLQNITAGTTTQYGSSESTTTNSNSCTTSSTIEANVTLTTNTVFELQHYCISTQNLNGFGLAVGIAGVNETYSRVLIMKYS